MSGNSQMEFDKKLLSHIKYSKNEEAKSMINRNLAKGFNDLGTLLHYAALYGNATIVRHLLNLGSDVDAIGRNGETPLMLALKINRTHAIKILLKANANIDIVNDDGESALKEVLNPADFSSEIFKIFIRKVKTETRTTGNLANRLIAAGCNMYQAINFRDINLMEYMLERGIDIDSRGFLERTALYTAVELHELELAKWLINNGADVNASDELGDSVLLEAADNGNEDMMKLLLEQGADPNCKESSEGRTPLLTVFELAVRRSDENFAECAQLLFQHGAVLKNSTKTDRTIFDFAFYWPNDKGVKLLISHLAVLEMLEAPITKLAMYCKVEKNQLKMPEYEHFYKQYQQILKISVYKKISLFKLLNASEHKMRLYVRDGAFISTVREFCSNNETSESYSYYCGAVEQRIIKAIRVVKLEDEAIPVVCTKIFKGDYNQCYNFARTIVSYLNYQDLQLLLEV